jgi:hypothetical protein
MKALLLIFAVWVLGSIVTFATVGTKYIIPYALATMALFALAVWLANKKNQPPAAGSAYSLALPLLLMLGVGSWQLGADLILLVLLAAASKAVADRRCIVDCAGRCKIAQRSISRVATKSPAPDRPGLFVITSVTNRLFSRYLWPEPSKVLLILKNPVRLGRGFFVPSE